MIHPTTFAKKLFLQYKKCKHILAEVDDAVRAQAHGVAA